MLTAQQVRYGIGMANFAYTRSGSNIDKAKAIINGISASEEIKNLAIKNLEARFNWFFLSD